MLRKISSIDFIATEIRYHRFCRTEYQTRAKKTPNRIEEEMNQKESVETNWHRDREKCIQKLLKALKNLFK